MHRMGGGEGSRKARPAMEEPGPKQPLVIKAREARRTRQWLKENPRLARRIIGDLIREKFQRGGRGFRGAGSNNRPGPYAGRGAGMRGGKGMRHRQSEPSQFTPPRRPWGESERRRRKGEPDRLVENIERLERELRELQRRLEQRAEQLERRENKLKQRAE